MQTLGLNRANTPFGYWSSTAFLPVWSHSHGTVGECQRQQILLPLAEQML